MPATHQTGTLIQLCSAAGPIWVAGPSKQDNAPDERHAAQAATCPMGMALAAVALPSSPVVLPAKLAVMAHPLAARAPPGPVLASVTGAPLGARAPPTASVSRCSCAAPARQFLAYREHSCLFLPPGRLAS
ncbi:hypothetical protein G6F22_017520 [Rhizopus arrhizus]|nr:hypothetical protein G6F22_017520 [Rhizopus arrhizus]